MPDHVPDQLDPAGRDLRAYTDELRPDHPVVRNDRGQWVLLRHGDVVEAARDAQRFSSAVSAHLQVPNGLDGDEHRAVREATDHFFSPGELTGLEPVLRTIARELVAGVGPGESVDAVELGARFAVRAQSAWLGWPAELEAPLLDWVAENHAATRSRDRARTAAVAAAFDEIIASVVEPRRALGDEAPDDVTTRLMHQDVAGRVFSDDEITSILRNWTGGDLGSIALCAGVVVAFLAAEERHVEHLRAADPAELESAIDEILRIDNPFLSNRRRTVCPVRVGGADIPAGDVVTLHWTSANRDESVVGDPDRFDPEGNAGHNLVYGTGPHVCPGRPLATMELRVLTEELLARGGAITWAGEPERETAPLGGYRRVPVVLG
ncbi:cytochrome P450 [Georgenia sp. Z1344]|uniref:cytochrome P450 n=1 Tax=Georgenia sp. Z1344 TaxID=3416706 RepID=UPI003CEC6B65